MKGLVLSLILIVGIGILFSSVYAQSTVHDIPFQSENVYIEKVLRVNLILVGDTWSSSEISNIKNSLPSSFEPMISSSEEKSGIKYYYDYKFVSASESDSSSLFSFMNLNAIEYDLLIHTLAWILFWHPEYVENPDDDFENYIYSYPYKIIDAELMEDYIYDNLIKNDSNLNQKNTANLVFLKGDLGQVNFFHNYALTQSDKSTNEEFNAFGMMGYGGKYNTYFIDLYATPWINYDTDSFEFYIPQYTENLLDCPTCFTDLVSSYTESAIYHIFTPSYLFPVEYNTNYLIDLVVYSIPGGSIGLTPRTAEEFIDVREIQSELKELMPYSNWDIDISIEKKSTRGLSLDFKDALGSFQHYNYYYEWEDREIPLAMYDSSRLQSHLLDWSKERNQISTSKDYTKIIPVLLAVDSTQIEVYLDFYGSTGFAAGFSDDESIPCCAFGVTDEKNVWDEKISSNDLILHEVGHTLGLMHSFQAYNDDSTNIIQNFYWDWYSSPMTYSSPGSGGCGLLFSLAYGSPCGIADSRFTFFEKQHIANGVLASILKNADERLTKYEKSNPKDYDTSLVNMINNNIKMSKEKIENDDYFSDNGALTTAIRAEYDSKSLFEDVDYSEIDPKTDDSKTKYGQIAVNKKIIEISRYDQELVKISGKISDEAYSKGKLVELIITRPDGTTQELGILVSKDKMFQIQTKVDYENQLGIYNVKGIYNDYDIGNISVEVIQKSVNVNPILTTPVVKQQVPGWIKNNAKWWSEGQISDNDFASGIQHMIKEKIINIPDLPEQSSGTAEENIPNWIRNNAQWWADDLISEDDFVNGVKYLVENGIIRV